MELRLGAMNFGKRTPARDAESILDAAVERGVTHVDTANAYNGGESERIVGAWAKRRRGAATIATKVGFGQVAGKPEGLSRARVLAACDESLGRLGVDAIDLYYLHVPDHATPIEETVDALAELFRAQKIRAWGLSNYASWEALLAMQAADRAGLPAPAASQQLYNLLIRQLDLEYFRFARRFELHTTVYNPLAGGMLARRHAADGSTTQGSRFDKNKLYLGRYWHAASFERVEALARVAEGAGLSLVELAYAWLADRPGVGSILVGPGSVAHLEAACAAVGRRVPDDAKAEIDALHVGWMGTESSYAR